MLRRSASTAERIVLLFDRIGQYMLPLLMGLIVIDVVGRRFLALPTVAIQEAEWHAHGVLFLFCIGATYLRDGHVRVELIRDRLSERARAVIEVAGTILFLLPYMAVILWYGIDLAVQSYASGEGSAAAQGLGSRWVIKSALPIGFALMMLAGAVVLFRSLAPDRVS